MDKNFPIFEGLYLKTKNRWNRKTDFSFVTEWKIWDEKWATASSLSKPPLYIYIVYIYYIYSAYSVPGWWKNDRGSQRCLTHPELYNNRDAQPPEGLASPAVADHQHPLKPPAHHSIAVYWGNTKFPQLIPHYAERRATEHEVEAGAS